MTYLLVAIAAALNAVMDILENENFHSSVFAKLDQSFWYKRESWKTARKIFGWKLDAWHIAKSAMIITLCIAIVTHEPIITGLKDLILLGIIWNLSFNTTYRLLKKR